MGEKRKILVITGTRAEYGLLHPVMKAIQQHPKLELLLMVTGMHLLDKYGMTIKEIESDGFTIHEQVKMAPQNDTGASMADAVSQGIQGMTRSFQRLKPDMILVLGDRIEPLAASIAAAYMNIPLVHVHGGDSARAGLDESVRHAISKFAHVHFAATKKSAERLRKMGEDPWRIHTVGAPGLDTILGTRLLNKTELENEIGVSLQPYALLVQHSVSTEPELAEKQAREAREAMKASGLDERSVYPNEDAGGSEVIKVIKEYEQLPQVHAFKNLHHPVYLSLMKHATVMVGNSSSGIIESSSFGLPVVNIGIRQDNRERSTNVIDVPHERKKILAAIRTATGPAFVKKAKKSKNPYGEGKAGVRMAKILAETAIDKKLIQKKLAY